VIRRALGPNEVEAGIRIERIGRGQPDTEGRPPASPAPEPLRLVTFLRENPSRIGPVVKALKQLREAVPELIGETIETARKAIDANPVDGAEECG
jgi:hypothetical protein